MEPQITPSYYTTSDAVISTETVFIVEISLTCKNRVQVREGGVQPGGYWGEKRVVSVGPWALATQLADPGTHMDFDALRSNSSSCSKNILLSFLGFFA